MKAFLFTAWLSRFRQGRYGESCVSLILHGGDREPCRQKLETLVLKHEPEPDSTAPKIEKITHSPVYEQLLTENGPAAIEWEKLMEEAIAALETTTPGDLGDGLWADNNALVPPDNLSTDLEGLRRDLPGDEAAGLNWSADKQMIFLVNVLTPPAPVRDIVGEELSAAEFEAHEKELEMRERQAAFPEMADRELTAVVRARNAVVAAWLWRRQAASTELARNAIRVDAFCEVLALDGSSAG